MSNGECKTTKDGIVLTEAQVAKAMLAVLNDRVGVKGNAGATEYLAWALGCEVEEAADLDEFEIFGVRFTKKVRTIRGKTRGRAAGMMLCWAVEERDIRTEQLA